MAVSNKRFAVSMGIFGALVIVALAVWAGYALGGSQSKPTYTAIDQKQANKSDENSDNAPADDSVPTQKLTVYYIAIDDNGKSGTKIGCGDSAVATSTGPVTTANPVEDAMKILVSNRQKDYGQSGLYNALYQSNLTVASVKVADATVKVDLNGTITQGGECDAPRIKAQLEETATKSAGVSKAAITVNGKSLDSVLSEK